MKKKNIGVMLDWDTLNSEEMTSAIKKAMTDRFYIFFNPVWPGFKE